MLTFNFSVKRFLQRMVSAGYSPDCVDVVLLPSLSFRVVKEDNVSPESVVFFYDKESDGLYATHAQFKMTTEGRAGVERVRTYYMSPDYNSVLPKFVIDALDAMT